VFVPIIPSFEQIRIISYDPIGNHFISPVFSVSPALVLLLGDITHFFCYLLQ